MATTSTEQEQTGTVIPHGERLARIEATLPHLATKADVANATNRLIVVTITGLGIAVAVIIAVQRLWQ